MKFNYATTEGKLKQFDAVNEAEAQKMTSGFADAAKGTGVMKVTAPATTTPTAPTLPTDVAAPASTTPEIPGSNIKTPESQGMSASFLSDTAKKMSDLATKTSDIMNSDETQSNLEKLRSSNEDTIKAGFDITREETQQALEAGLNLAKRTAGNIALSDIQTSSKLQEYSDNVKTFTSNTARTFERLNLEETAAINTNDATYLKDVRQAKLDAINAERNALSDSFNVMTQTFNMMMTGKQFSRQETLDEQKASQDKLDSMIKTYGGAGYTLSKLPEDTQKEIVNAANTLGYDYDTINAMLSAPSDVQIIADYAGGKLVGIDKKGNVVFSKNALTPSGKAAPTVTETLQGLADAAGRLLPIGQKTTDMTGYAAAYQTWMSVAPQQLGTFFKNYPIDNYIDSSKLSGKDKDLYTSIVNQSKQFTKTDAAASLMFLQGLISGGLGN